MCEPISTDVFKSGTTSKISWIKTVKQRLSRLIWTGFPTVMEPTTGIHSHSVTANLMLDNNSWLRTGFYFVPTVLNGAEKTRVLSPQTNVSLAVFSWTPVNMCRIRLSPEVLPRVAQSASGAVTWGETALGWGEGRHSVRSQKVDPWEYGISYAARLLCVFCRYLPKSKPTKCL